MSGKRIVRRLLDEDDLTFTTRLTSARGGGVLVDHGPEWIEANADVHIKWSLELEAREWGVKSFDVTVQQVTVYLHLYDEQEQEHEEVVTVPSQAPAAPPEGDARAELLHYGRPEDYKLVTRFNTVQSETHEYIPGLVPNHVEIDMRKRVIEISF